jgi:ubiquinone biosynthesis protein
MRNLFDAIRIILFFKKLSQLGSIIHVAKRSKLKILYLASFVFSPINTIKYIFNPSSLPDVSTIFKKLGPIYIKFGQTLSTRQDLIGIDLSENLKTLQDKIEPMKGKDLDEVIKRGFGTNLENIFSELDKTPIASASVAQVHKAILKDGSKVAVKILKTGIKEQYQDDIKNLYILSRIANKIFLKSSRLRLLDAVRVFENMMKFELDLKNEAAAASELKDNLKDDKDVFIPKIYWDYTSAEILVLEWIEGTSIYDTKRLDEFSIDKKELAKKLAITFLNQSFRDGFFHADLHPGNILVLKDGRIAFIDFGIMGKLSDRDRLAMAEVLYCLLSRNYKRVAEIHVEIGFVPKDTDIQDFALATRAITEPIIGKPTSEVYIGHLVESLFKMTADFGMITQPQLIQLQKTILVVEGIGKILAADVNMWNLAEPWIRKWAAKNLGFDAKIAKFIKHKIEEYRNLISKNS